MSDTDLATDDDQRPSTRFALVHSPAHVAAADFLPSNTGRAAVVHALIDALAPIVLRSPLRRVAPRLATDDEIREFHSEAFVSRILRGGELGRGKVAGAGVGSGSDGEDVETDEDDEDDEEDAGLAYDCPPFPQLPAYVRTVAGGTLTAARLLCSGQVDAIAHWEGGRHHAHRDEAAGFCYVNDVVLGIIELHTRFDRVLYIDVDVHHCDGVERAFSTTAKVLRVSLHLHEPGFFPGTGARTPADARGKNTSTFNVLLPRGTRTAPFFAAFVAAVAPLVPLARAVVLQCGVDGHLADPLAARAWRRDGAAAAAAVAAGGRVPLMVLGGGGYASATAARVWAACTMVMASGASCVPGWDEWWGRSGVAAVGGEEAGVVLRLVREWMEGMDVPEHDGYLLFGPDFTMEGQKAMDVSVGL
ncbi:hypothetical protein DFJ73DRAFT_663526 [Zopfochytrium polystomum]|nr:hypothetical protein DFJ73DRAFT_663526 [Zopfochytrium polystomum]